MEWRRLTEKERIQDLRNWSLSGFRQAAERHRVQRLDGHHHSGAHTHLSALEFLQKSVTFSNFQQLNPPQLQMSSKPICRWRVGHG
ncbi:hypothetical protein M758_4G220400 [Ceratodon purpureus]|nr:hypothetical protein M758_4G220400 [Ceratodon purpureus]